MLLSAPKILCFSANTTIVEPDVSSPKISATISIKDAHPTPADVLLLVEVSKTTLGYDKGKKLNLYARLNIVEVWIVNLLGERSRSLPPAHRSGIYGKVNGWYVGESIAPAAFPDREVVVLRDALL